MRTAVIATRLVGLGVAGALITVASPGARAPRVPDVTVAGVELSSRPNDTTGLWGVPALDDPPTAAVQATEIAAAPVARPGATTVPSTPPNSSEPVRRGEDALATIAYPWEQRLPGWSVTFAPGRDGLLGATLVNEEQIRIYVRDDQSDALLAHVIAHEIGHAVDVTFNDGDERRQWQDARGIGDAPWWPGNGADDFSTGAGDFAESFAAWQVGSNSFRGRLGAAPTGEQLALMVRLAAG